MARRSSKGSGYDAPTPRKPMPLEDRAKIFVPFDPLAGFREALRAKEREVEQRTR
ncbi:MAG: hypothetical protein IKG22_08705 [Atopobiaceae bacterium]|nr:hypothetical protein [Atopobiaceae bacterium]